MRWFWWSLVFLTLGCGGEPDSPDAGTTPRVTCKGCGCGGAPACDAGFDHGS